MDQDKLCDTDIELIFSNNKRQVTIHAHKNILASSCDYFRKMFNFNGNITTTKIIVDEPHIARDIIHSFYGIDRNSSNYPKWRYILEVFKTRQFFCLDNDVGKLYDLSVPSDGFDLFLEVASQFDIVNDQQLIRNIKRNLPEKYDFGKFSDSFIEVLRKKNYIIAYGCRDNTIKLWGDIPINDKKSSEKKINSTTKKINLSKSLFPTDSPVHTLTGHTDSVYSIAISPDGSRVASGSSDSTIKIWDVDNGSLIHTLKGHDESVICVAYSPDGLQIISGSDDRTIKIWDTVNGAVLNTLSGHTDLVRTVAFSPDGLRIVSGSRDKTIKIWDVVDGSLIHTLTDHTYSVMSVAYSPDGLQIVSGNSNRTIRIWDAVNGSLLRTFEGHTDSVNSVAYSPNGLRIVSGSCDKTIKIWDAVNGSLIRTLTGHTNWVWSVGFSPDSLQIVSGKIDRSAIDQPYGKIDPGLTTSTGLVLSGSADSTVKIWDSVNGSLLHTITGNTDSITSATFFPVW